MITTIIYLTLLAISLAGCWGIFRIASAQSRYRKQIARIYRHRYPQKSNYVVPDPDELANRVNEYCYQKHGRPKRSRHTRYIGGKAVQVSITDGRDLWEKRSAMHDQQTNNVLRLLTADLDPKNTQYELRNTN